MEEIWKDIKDFDGYQVSSLGRIKSFKQDKDGKLLKIAVGNRGYSVVSLHKDGKGYRKTIHRLVLENFLPIPNMDSMEVNHKDENKQNNCLENLEWLTHKDNVNYGTGKERSARKQAQKIMCVETGEIFDSMRIASEKSNINYGNISSACSNPNRTAGGFHWIKI